MVMQSQTKGLKILIIFCFLYLFIKVFFLLCIFFLGMFVLFDINSKVISRYVKISPNKLRRIVGFIKNKSVYDALFVLQFLPHRGSKILSSLISAAYKNLENFSSFDKKSVLIKCIQVDDGPFFKRFQPHAQGRSFPIKKRTSHIIIKL